MVTQNNFVPVSSEKPSGFYRLCLYLVRLTAWLLLRLSKNKISGRENIPKTGGFIFASNHASHLDPPVLAVASPRQLTYLAKIELFKNPVFARLIKSLGAFPIQRGKGDMKAIETAASFLKAGHALVVFPEGTRTLTGKIGRIRFGAARLAILANAPIVPAYISGTYKAWPKHGKIKSGNVTVKIGNPIQPESSEDTPSSCAKLTKRIEEIFKKFEAEEIL